MLQWDEIYCFQKMLPLLTRWQLHHFAEKPNEPPKHGMIQPDFIKKKRAPKGIPSYEVIWSDNNGDFKYLIPEEQLQTFYKTNSKEDDQQHAHHLLWSTIEPIDLVEKAYPVLVEQFITGKEKPKNRKKKAINTANTAQRPKKSKKTNENTSPNENDEQTSQPAPKKHVRKVKNAAKKALPTGKPTTLDRFLIQQTTTTKPYQSPKIKTTSKPLNLSAFSIDFNESFDDHSMNLSQIINDIVAKTPKITECRGKKLKYDIIESSPLLTTEQPNASDNGDGDENDEFDLIVTRKNRRNTLHRVNDLHSSTIDPVICSTPLIARKTTMNDREFFLTPTAEKSTHSQQSLIVSSFFAAHNEHGDIDLFEKSIDFRNIEDEEATDSERYEEDSSNSSNAADNHLSNGSYCDKDVENDTFDRLVGAGKL